MTVKDNNEKPLVKVNILKNRYVTDGNIWIIDETIFNENTKLFLIINLKTRAIIRFIIYKNNLNEDILIELYNQIFYQYSENNPIIVHSDNEPIFKSDNILELIADRGIEPSFTGAKKNQNQVSEAINERIKTLVTKNLIIKDSKGLRNWRNTVPNKFKHLKINDKSRNVKLQKSLL